MKKALFIDDNPEVLDLISEAIKGLSVKCDYVDKLSTAYELIKKSHYDYIFLDFKMGSIDADGLLFGIDKKDIKIYIFTNFKIEFVKKKLKGYLDKIEGFIEKQNLEDEVIRILK